MTTLRGEGVTTFLELGPDATLTAMTRQSLAGEDAVLVPSLRSRRPEAETFLGFLAQAHVAGVPVDWPASTPAPAPAAWRCRPTRSSASGTG